MLAELLAMLAGAGLLPLPVVAWCYGTWLPGRRRKVARHRGHGFAARARDRSGAHRWAPGSIGYRPVTTWV